MTYGEIKKAVLQLIGEYTIAGTVIADSYNGHADKTQEIPFLISSAVTDIRTGVKPKRAVLPVTVDSAIQNTVDSAVQCGGNSSAWNASEQASATGAFSAELNPTAIGVSHASCELYLASPFHQSCGQR